MGPGEGEEDGELEGLRDDGGGCGAGDSFGSSSLICDCAGCSYLICDGAGFCDISDASRIDGCFGALDDAFGNVPKLSCAPQFVQNLAPSSIFAPQLLQYIIVLP